MKIRRRWEGEVIPEGISVTETGSAVYIYVRRGDQIAVIRLPYREGRMYYEVTSR